MKSYLFHSFIQSLSEVLWKYLHELVYTYPLIQLLRLFGDKHIDR